MSSFTVWVWKLSPLASKSVSDVVMETETYLRKPLLSKMKLIWHGLSQAKIVVAEWYWLNSCPFLCTDTQDTDKSAWDGCWWPSTYLVPGHPQSSCWFSTVGTILHMDAVILSSFKPEQFPCCSYELIILSYFALSCLILSHMYCI